MKKLRQKLVIEVEIEQLEFERQPKRPEDYFKEGELLLYSESYTHSGHDPYGTILSCRQLEKTDEAVLHGVVDAHENEWGDDESKAARAVLVKLGICGTCGGVGEIDSGGVDQNDQPINVPCSECSSESSSS